MRGLFMVLAVVFSLQVKAAPVEFIAFGDAPFYNPPEDVSMFRKLIAQVNAEQPAFAVHVGDIRGGGADCSDATFQKVYDLFNQIISPVVYTPGDNDWTDCQGSLGKRDPLDALNGLRTRFFATDMSLGKNPMPMERQPIMHGYFKFSENRRWRIGDVFFFTVHIVGSNNNFPGKLEDGTVVGNLVEFNDRMRANLAWLDESFAWAKAEGAKALVMIYHADMQYYKKPDERQGHEPLIQKLRQHLASYKGEVLGVQGDSHKFIVDQPVYETKPWDFEWPVKNFTRLQVYGSPDVRGVKVTVDTTKAQPFKIEPMPMIEWEYPLPTSKKN